MEPLTANHQPSDVIAEGGNIIVEGPDGVAFTLSPDAAEETAHRLLRAVSEVREGDDRPDRAPSEEPG